MLILFTGDRDYAVNPKEVRAVGVCPYKPETQSILYFSNTEEYATVFGTVREVMDRLNNALSNPLFYEDEL